MTTPLSFGVELELLLSFHSSLLFPHLHPSTTLLKSLPPTTLSTLVASGYESSVTHLSWAVSGPEPDSIRAYEDEPLKLAQSLVTSAPGFEDTRVFFETSYKAKHVDYDAWTIVGDPSLQSLSKTEMLSAFLERIGADAGEWDSWGIEFVSPVFPATSLSSFSHQVDGLMASLSGCSVSQHGATINAHCGLHGK
jgi:hypothetical protein